MDISKIPVCPHVQTVSYVDLAGRAGVVQGQLDWGNPPVQPDCEVCRKLLAHDDLLAACEALISQLRTQARIAQQLGGDIALAEDNGQVWNQARAAIAKAT